MSQLKDSQNANDEFNLALKELRKSLEKSPTPETTKRFNDSVREFITECKGSNRQIEEVMESSQRFVDDLAETAKNYQERVKLIEESTETLKLITRILNNLDKFFTFIVVVLIFTVIYLILTK